MADPNTLLDIFWPSPKAAVYAVAGFLFSAIWAGFRARRIAVTWTATFQQIKPTGLEPMSAKISVQINDKPAYNLQACRVMVKNDSSRDIADIDLLLTFFDPFVIIEDHAFLGTSAKNLLRTERFQQAVSAVLAAPEAQRAAHTSFPYVIRNREYQLPALNRGDTATFSFWIHSNSMTDVPKVLVSSEKVGVRVISRPADIRWLDYTTLKPAGLIGTFIALGVAAVVASLELSPIAMSLSAAIAGVAAGVTGLSVVHFFRWLRRMV